MGTYFLNVRRLMTVAEEHLGYRGELQLLVDADPVREHLTVRLDERYAPAPEAALDVFLATVPELASATAESLLTCTVETVPTSAFDRTPTSGKLRTVVDRRPATA
ncbi:hypothetical protein ACFQ1I_09115 [Kitasatospora arboriphila]